jgi:hypothetical protein
VVVAQLLRSGHSADALPHLTVLYRLQMAAARHEDAAGVARVAQEIDPNWVPDSEVRAEEKLSDLPFLMLDGDTDGGLYDLTTILTGDIVHTREPSNRRGQGDRRRGGDRRKSPRGTDASRGSRSDVVL